MRFVIIGACISENMPNLRDVDSLRTRSVKRLSDYVHELLKDCTSRRKSKGRSRPPFSRIQEDRFRAQLINWTQSLPANVGEDFAAALSSRIRADAEILAEGYYRCVSPAFMNERTKSLRLCSARFFQDSSVAMEAFLSNLSASPALRDFTMSKQVTDLACFELEPLLDCIARKNCLESVTIQGLSCTEVDRDEMEIFLTDLIENCSKLQHLDLSGSPIDSRCCDLISDLESLRILRLENCPGVDTASVVSILARRSKTLAQFECGNKLQNALGVVAADSSTDSASDCDDSKPGAAVSLLRQVTFRQPTGIAAVARSYPNVDRVRVVHSDYENTALLDRSLPDLNLFPCSEFSADLEMEGINMLFLIQMDNLSHYGRHLTKLVFTQCDFLHPQSLNPFARHCPNLRSLNFFGCEDVGDDMFVGELPALVEEPFRCLEELVFEGFLRIHVARFLLKSCLTIGTVKLHTTKAFNPEILSLLAAPARDNLRELHLTVSRVADGGHDELLELLVHLVENSAVLGRLEVLSCDPAIGDGLQELGALIRRRNWSVEYLHHVNRRPSRTRT